jgi:hypothetical protein
MTTRWEQIKTKVLGMPKDVRGIEIEVGDTIVWGYGRSSPELAFGKVTDIKPRVESKFEWQKVQRPDPWSNRTLTVWEKVCLSKGPTGFTITVDSGNRIHKLSNIVVVEKASVG